MGAWTLFADLFLLIQGPLLASTDALINALAGPVGRVLRVTIVVLISARMLRLAIQGGSGNPLSELEGQLILCGAVFLLSSQVATYHTYIADLFLQRLGQEITGLITGVTGPAVVGGAAFDGLWNKAFVAGVTVYKQLSSFDVGLQIIVGLYWLIAVVAITFAFGIYLCSFVVLALLIGIGPIFVAMYAVPAVRGVSQRWLGSLITMVTLQILVVALLALLINVETITLAKISDDGTGNAFTKLQFLFGGIVLFIIAGGLLFQLPGIASGLAGGLTFHAGHVFAAAAAGGSSAASAIGAATAGVAAGGSAVSSGARSAGRAIAGRSRSAG